MGEKERWCLFAAGDQETADTLLILKCTHKITESFSHKTLTVLLLKFACIGGVLVMTQGNYVKEKYRMCISEPGGNSKTPADADIGNQ